LLNTLKVEKIFVYLAIIFGLIFVMIIPPFQSPDEDSHFKKAYVVSKGNFFPVEKDNKLGYYLPDDMVNYIGEKLKYAGNLDKKYSFKEMYFDERLPKDYTKKSFYNFSTSEINPFVYVAPATGISISRAVSFLFNLNDNESTVYMLYFARIFSLIAYTILIYFAIKTTPIMKKTFALIGLLPMSLSLASCISYDSVLMPLSLLLTGIILKIAYDKNEKMERKYLIPIIIIGCILFTVKIVYSSLLFLLLLIPKEKWGKRHSNIKAFTIIIGIMVGFSFLLKIPHYMLNINPDSNSLPGDQLSYIISNPLNYIVIILRTIKDSFYFFLSGMVGTFGLLDTNLLVPFVLLYFVTFVSIAISDASLCDKKLAVFNKLVIIISVLASVFGIFTGMYLFWTSVLPGYGIGASTISGVQGRYFIPLLPAIFLMFINSKIIKTKYPKKFAKILLDNYLIFPIIILILTAITIIFRYWC